MTLGVYPSKVGGAEIHSYEQARIMVERGVSTCVITPRHGAGTSWAAQFGWSTGLLGPLMFTLGSFVAMLRARKKIEVVHVHYATYFPLPAFLLHAITGTPYMISCHGGDVLRFGQQRFWKTFQGIMMRGAASVTAASSEVEKILRERYNLPATKVMIVRNGVNPREIALVDTRRETNRLAYVANLRMEKDPLTAVRAFEIARGSVPGLKMTMVGDGVLRREVEALVRERGLGDHVAAVGTLPHHEAMGVIGRSAVLILSSKSEGGNPLVLMEAMALGTPVVACAVGGVKDIVHDCINGILVSPSDHEAIARAIIRLVTDHQLWQSISRAAVKSSQDRTWSDSVNRYMEIYASVGTKVAVVEGPPPVQRVDSSSEVHSSAAARSYLFRQLVQQGNLLTMT